MKAGATISSIAHAGILGWGLIFLDVAPPDFQIELDHAQIDVAKEDNLELATGDTEADVSPNPAPVKTTAPVLENPARNFGDAKQDLDSRIEKQERNEPVEVSASAKNNNPDPLPVVKPELDEADIKEDTPVPTSEIASLNEPAVPVNDNRSELQPSSADEGQEFARLPDNVPLPVVRPAQSKQAKTLDRKNVDKIRKKTKKSQSNSNEQSADDKIANLLNKQKPSAAGAKRSNRQASLGSRNNNSSNTLSRGEMDGLIDAISACSSGITGRLISEDLRIKVEIQLARDGSIIGNPLAEARGGTQSERKNFSREVLRYVKRCAPYDFLPKDKYDSWAVVIPTFYPAKMFE